MARRRDAGKEAAWRKRLKRFGRSGLTVARFCDGERVSVASFYYWQKKLGQRASRQRKRSRSGVFRQVAVVPARPTMASGMLVAARETPGVLSAPPEVVPTTSAVASAAPADVPGATKVSIQLPWGTRIEMDGGHLDLVRAVVGEVMGAHAGVQAGIRSC